MQAKQALQQQQVVAEKLSLEVHYQAMLDKAQREQMGYQTAMGVCSRNLETEYEQQFRFVVASESAQVKEALDRTAAQSEEVQRRLAQSRAEESAAQGRVASLRRECEQEVQESSRKELDLKAKLRESEAASASAGRLTEEALQHMKTCRDGSQMA